MLRWGQVRDRTLVVNAGKTGQTRTVQLLAPLAADLAAWRLVNGRPPDSALVFPGHDRRPWTKAAYQSWRRRAFDRARRAADAGEATPYTLRHPFCSLLLAEGRTVIYVARQLGHGAALTLGTYGHVIDELDGAERVEAEAAIRAAREAHVPFRTREPLAVTPRRLLSVAATVGLAGLSFQWAVPDSNRRPPACKAGALPAELTAQKPMLERFSARGRQQKGRQLWAPVPKGGACAPMQHSARVSKTVTGHFGPSRVRIPPPPLLSQIQPVRQWAVATVRDGRVFRTEIYSDPAEALEAVGLRE
jgi:hypothetical protein